MKHLSDIYGDHPWDQEEDIVIEYDVSRWGQAAILLGLFVLGWLAFTGILAVLWLVCRAIWG